VRVLFLDANPAKSKKKKESKKIKKKQKTKKLRKRLSPFLKTLTLIHFLDIMTLLDFDLFAKPYFCTVLCASIQILSQISTRGLSLFLRFVFFFY
jgi:hypothetical protein